MRAGIGNDSVTGDRGSTASMVARYQTLIAYPRL